MLVFPLPVIVNGCDVALLMPPVKLNVPAFDPIVAPAAPNVIAPDHVLLFAKFNNDPAELMPLPIKVIGSAIDNAVPSTCTAAPLLTLVPLPVPPNALLFCTSTMPALTVVAPVYVLVPDKVNVPLPVLVSPPAPFPITSDTLMFPVFASKVRVLFPFVIVLPDPLMTNVLLAPAPIVVARSE